MIPLNYNGFSNLPSVCQYAIGTIGGKRAIVFLQMTMTGTSITNMVEALTMHVLATALPGEDPNQIRVFEHYDPSLKPIVEWQEVSFADIGQIQEKTSIATKLIQLVVPSTTPKVWYVNNPRWMPVSPADKAVVSAIQ